MKKLEKILNGDVKLSHLFSITLIVRLISASIAPILDCDETFNYIEPLHYMLFGYGFQTWEYAPQFALRSWAFISLYSIIGFPLKFLGLSKTSIFFAMRSVLALFSSGVESYFILAIQKKFGITRAMNTWLLMTAGTGMFFASTAILRNSFSMHLIMLSFASWLNDFTLFSILFMAFAGLWGEVTCIFVAIAMGGYLVYDKGVVKCVFSGIIALLITIPPMIAIDSYFYGKTVSTVLNFAIYNSQVSGGAGGQNLYGVEPWYWYFINLFLNFNIAFPAALLGMGLCPEVGVWFSIPFALLFLFFSFMPHKEERFFFIGFPLLCVLAASFFDTQGSRKRIISRKNRVGVIKRKVVHGAWHGWTHGTRLIFSMLRPLIFMLYVILSVSRIAGIVTFYGASLQIWTSLDTHLTEQPELREICAGNEWFRFHSHFFLAEGRELKFLKADFGGQLPALFDGGTAVTHEYFNDQNQEEPSRYFPVEDCDVLVQEGQPPKGWKQGICLPFLNKDETPRYARTFYFPFFKDSVSWTQLCWFVRE